MKVQHWIFTVRYFPECPEGAHDFQRFAIVGPAQASTVEAVLHLGSIPEAVRAEIRANDVVRKFVDGQLDTSSTGYYAPCPVAASTSWLVCIGSVQEVLA